ncbi:hypothetical protein DKL51_31940 [Micromonospora globispora]|nr:hypothetical protein DKL51_31940 [Micromonospora globispora]
MGGRLELTDVEYGRIGPLLPAMTRQRGGRRWPRTGSGGSSPPSHRTCCGATTSPRSSPTRASSTSPP